ncbi:MAG: zinc-binding alcohol dehydrogenase family protein [Desulfofustis sp.]|nr:zinc-binding alcohol dehydrogenase family protein [Desulfofustis sp.]
MKAVVCSEPGTVSLETQPVPQRVPGTALLRMTRLGICGTDLHAFAGRQPFFSYPRILGHEMAAEVVAVDPDAHGLSAGDRVAVVPYIACGHCVACRRGRPNCCVHLNVLGVHSDGGMREYLLAPVDRLIKHATLTNDQLALCECLSIGAHAVRRAAIEPGEQVLVIGAGPIGLGVMQFAHLAGGAVLAMDISRERLEFAAGLLPLAGSINAGEARLKEQLEAATGGDLPTIIFDATGNIRSMMNAFDYLAHGGRYVLVSLVNAEICFSDPEFHKRETTLLSSRNATVDDFRWVMDAIAQQRVQVDSLITHRCSLGETVRHLRRWARPETGVIKAIVEI